MHRPLKTLRVGTNVTVPERYVMHFDLGSTDGARPGRCPIAGTHPPFPYPAPPVSGEDTRHERVHGCAAPCPNIPLGSVAGPFLGLRLPEKVSENCPRALPPCFACCPLLALGLRHSPHPGPTVVCSPLWAPLSRPHRTPRTQDLGSPPRNPAPMPPAPQHPVGQYTARTMPACSALLPSMCMDAVWSHMLWFHMRQVGWLGQASGHWAHLAACCARKSGSQEPAVAD